MKKIARNLREHYGPDMAMSNTTVIQDYQLLVDPESQIAPSFETDPVDWIVMKLLTPLALSHLTSIPSLEEISEVLADATGRLQELAELLEADSLVHVSALALAGLGTPEQPIRSGQYLVRPISALEESELARTNLDQYPRAPIAKPPLTSLSLPTAVVEIERRSPRSVHYEPTSSALPLVVSLQLAGFRISGTGTVLHYVRPEWAFRFNHFTHVDLRPDTENDSVCSQEGWDEVASLADMIPLLGVLQPQNPLHLALQRFNLGCGRDRSVDSVLDFVIALEALLLPESITSETTHRFRVNGANLLADTAQDRLKLWKELGDIYSLRSTLVHGGRKYPSHEVVERTAYRCRDLASRALKKALSGGPHTEEDFRRLALSSGE